MKKPLFRKFQHFLVTLSNECRDLLLKVQFAPYHYHNLACLLNFASFYVIVWVCSFRWVCYLHVFQTDSKLVLSQNGSSSAGQATSPGVKISEGIKRTLNGLLERKSEERVL